MTQSTDTEIQIDMMRSSNLLEDNYFSGRYGNSEPQKYTINTLLGEMSAFSRSLTRTLTITLAGINALATKNGSNDSELGQIARIEFFSWVPPLESDGTRLQGAVLFDSKGTAVVYVRDAFFRDPYSRDICHVIMMGVGISDGVIAALTSELRIMAIYNVILTREKTVKRNGEAIAILDGTVESKWRRLKR